LNRWDIRLGDGKTFRLRIKTGVTRGRIGPRRLPITDLRVDTGVQVHGREAPPGRNCQDGRRVGNFRVIVDEDVPVRATVRGLTSVLANGGFSRRRGNIFSYKYTNPAYEELKGPRLEFDITMGVGSVTLDTR
jgi:hypothetical protein